MDPITILFGTEMGTAEGCANRFGEALRLSNLENEIVDMNDYDHADLESQGLLIIITSTTGSGDPPANAKRLFQHLSENKPNLSSRFFAVMALGDSYHPNFAQCGKDFDRMLEELGAKRIIERVDCDGNVEKPFKEFQRRMFDFFEREIDEYPMYTAAENSEEESEEQVPNESTQKQEHIHQKSFLRSVLSRVKRKLLNNIK